MAADQARVQSLHGECAKYCHNPAGDEHHIAPASSLTPGIHARASVKYPRASRAQRASPCPATLTCRREVCQLPGTLVHPAAVKPGGNTWAETNWKGQSGRLWSDFGGLGSGLGEKLLTEIWGMVSVQGAESGIGACLDNCGLKRVSRALGHPTGYILSQFSLVKLSRLKLLSCFSSGEFQTLHKLKQPLTTSPQH